MDQVGAGGGRHLRCSFCGREKPTEVRELIAGPGVYICVECVGLCNKIIRSKADETARDRLGHGVVPTPQETHAFLEQYVVGQ